MGETRSCPTASAPLLSALVPLVRSYPSIKQGLIIFSEVRKWALKRDVSGIETVRNKKVSIKLETVDNIGATRVIDFVQAKMTVLDFQNQSAKLNLFHELISFIRPSLKA